MFAVLLKMLHGYCIDDRARGGEECGAILNILL